LAVCFERDGDGWERITVEERVNGGIEVVSVDLDLLDDLIEALLVAKGIYRPFRFWHPTGSSRTAYVPSDSADRNRRGA
jgi:hypothetical protein